MNLSYMFNVYVNKLDGYSREAVVGFIPSMFLRETYTHEDR